MPKYDRLDVAACAKSIVKVVTITDTTITNVEVLSDEIYADSVLRPVSVRTVDLMPTEEKMFDSSFKDNPSGQ